MTIFKDSVQVALEILVSLLKCHINKREAKTHTSNLHKA